MDADFNDQFISFPTNKDIELVDHLEIPLFPSLSPERFVNDCNSTPECETKVPLQEVNSPGNSSSKKRYNAHRQLSGDKRILLSKLLDASDGKVAKNIISKTFDISEDYASTLIRTYQKNGTLINSSPRKRGRRSLIESEGIELIRKIIMKDNTISDKEVAEILHKELNLSKPPNRSTIHRYRKYRMEENGSSLWTVRKWTITSLPSSQLTQVRVKQVLSFYRTIEESKKLLVFVDEMSSEFHCKIGSKSSSEKENIMSFSAVCAFSTRGVEHYIISQSKSIQEEVFSSFFEELVQKVGDCPCVFLMDTADVHDQGKISQLCIKSNHTVCFYKANSLELSPLISFFNHWKAEVMKQYVNMHSMEEVKKCLEDSICSIDSAKCSLFITDINEFLKNTTVAL